MSEHALRRRRFKEISAVLQRQTQFLIRFRKVQGEIELRRRRVYFQWPEADTGTLEFRQSIVSAGPASPGTEVCGRYPSPAVAPQRASQRAGPDECKHR